MGKGSAQFAIRYPVLVHYSLFLYSLLAILHQPISSGIGFTTLGLTNHHHRVPTRFLLAGFAAVFCFAPTD